MSQPSLRHLTATGFIARGNRTLLHWHRKNQLWLPFGGHIEPGEDPVQCVLREAEEETGIVCRVLHRAPELDFSDPPQIPPPFTILVEQASDGQMRHEHVDLIYFLVPADPASEPDLTRDGTMRWFTREELEAGAAVSVSEGQPPVVPPLDVRELGVAAIVAAKAASPAGRSAGRDAAGLRE